MHNMYIIYTYCSPVSETSTVKCTPCSSLSFFKGLTWCQRPGKAVVEAKIKGKYLAAVCSVNSVSYPSEFLLTL